MNARQQSVIRELLRQSEKHGEEQKQQKERIQTNMNNILKEMVMRMNGFRAINWPKMNLLTVYKS